jgi:hypothetical protein
VVVVVAVVVAVAVVMVMVVVGQAGKLGNYSIKDGHSNLFFSTG